MGTHVLGNAVGNYGLSDQPHAMFSRVVGTGAQGIAGGWRRLRVSTEQRHASDSFGYFNEQYFMKNETLPKLDLADTTV